MRTVLVPPMDFVLNLVVGAAARGRMLAMVVLVVAPYLEPVEEAEVEAMPLLTERLVGNGVIMEQGAGEIEALAGTQLLQHRQRQPAETTVVEMAAAGVVQPVVLATLAA